MVFLGFNLTENDKEIVNCLLFERDDDILFNYVQYLVFKFVLKVAAFLNFEIMVSLSIY